MKVWVTLYSTTDKGHANVFTLECRMVRQAVEALPRLMTIHRQRHHLHCPLDAWTVHTVHATTRLPRIQVRGVIRDGTAIPPTDNHNQLAD